jgi:hypothetical protein
MGGNIREDLQRCLTPIIGEAADMAFAKLVLLMDSHGLDPEGIPDEARAIGPLCEKCLAKWADELKAS